MLQEGVLPLLHFLPPVRDYSHLFPRPYCPSDQLDLSFRVFRAQLPKENPFVADQGEEEEEDNQEEPSLDDFLFLEGSCHVCGWAAKKHCAKCKECESLASPLPF